MEGCDSSEDQRLNRRFLRFQHVQPRRRAANKQELSPRHGSYLPVAIETETFFGFCGLGPRSGDIGAAAMVAASQRTNTVHVSFILLTSF
jgi:hypothetical protein